MNADAQGAGRQTRHRESIIDLGGAELIEAEGYDLGERQVLLRRRYRVGGKAVAARKKFVQEALQVVVVRVGKQTAMLEKPRRPKAGFPPGLLQAARFRLIAIAPIA